jgi:hypothetical protein
VPNTVIRLDELFIATTVSLVAALPSLSYLHHVDSPFNHSDADSGDLKRCSNSQPLSINHTLHVEHHFTSHKSIIAFSAIHSALTSYISSFALASAFCYDWLCETPVFQTFFDPIFSYLYVTSFPSFVDHSIAYHAYFFFLLPQSLIFFSDF